MHLTRRFEDYRHAAALEALTRSFLPHFPELEHVDFELDLLPSTSWLLGVTEDRPGMPRVRLRPARPTNPSLTYTVPHEFTHLLQRPLRIVPQGERACDLWAMARAGERFRVPPSYLSVPRSVRADWTPWAGAASTLARGAVEERSAGRRRYLRWWEQELRGLAIHSPHAPRSRLPEPSFDPLD